MSTIGSDYTSHRRSLDELETEYENSAKKAKERESTREKKLQKNLESIVRKKDSELESAVRNVKDEYESTMKSQAKSDLAERNRMAQVRRAHEARQRAEAVTLDGAGADEPDAP